jgi:maltoporin
MREGAPASGVPAGIGGKAAQSGEKGDEVSLREFYVKTKRLQEPAGQELCWAGASCAHFKDIVFWENKNEK